MLTREEVVADWLKELDKAIDDWKQELEGKQKLRANLEERVAILKEVDQIRHKELIKAYEGVVRNLTKDITSLNEVNLKHGEELKQDLAQKFESQ